MWQISRNHETARSLEIREMLERLGQGFPVEQHHGGGEGRKLGGKMFLAVVLGG